MCSIWGLGTFTLASSRHHRLSPELPQVPPLQTLSPTSAPVPALARFVSDLILLGPHSRSHSGCPRPGWSHSAPALKATCAVPMCPRLAPSSGWLTFYCVPGPHLLVCHRPVGGLEQPQESAAPCMRGLWGRSSRPSVASRCPCRGLGIPSPGKENRSLRAGHVSQTRPAVHTGCRREGRAADPRVVWSLLILAGLESRFRTKSGYLRYSCESRIRSYLREVGCGGSGACRGAGMWGAGCGG